MLLEIWPSVCNHLKYLITGLEDLTWMPTLKQADVCIFFFGGQLIQDSLFLTAAIVSDIYHKNIRLISYRYNHCFLVSVIDYRSLFSNRNVMEVIICT